MLKLLEGDIVKTGGRIFIIKGLVKDITINPYDEGIYDAAEIKEEDTRVCAADLMFLSDVEIFRMAQ